MRYSPTPDYCRGCRFLDACTSDADDARRDQKRLDRAQNRTFNRLTGSEDPDAAAALAQATETYEANQQYTDRVIAVGDAAVIAAVQDCDGTVTGEEGGHHTWFERRRGDLPCGLNPIQQQSILDTQV